MHPFAYLVGYWAMTRLLVVLCLFIASPSFAATWRDGGGWNAAPVSQGSDGVWSVLPDMSSPNNGHVTTCTTSSCTRTGSLPAPVGRGSPRLSPSAVFPKAALVTGALALGGRVLPWLTVGKGLYDWYQAAGVNVQPDGDPTETSGGTVTGTGWWTSASPVGSVTTTARYASGEAVCAAVRQATYDSMAATGLYSSHTVSLSVQTVSSTRLNCNLSGPWVRTNGQTGNLSVSYATNKSSDAASHCFDASTGLYVVDPTGGLCPAGVQVPLSHAQAEAKLNNANITADVLKRSLEEVLKAGGSLQDTGTHTVTGPASVLGETKTKTTTAANGTTQVTTVTNNYNYNYAGNTVTITTTEVIQNPDGSTETTTSDTPDPLCAENPNSLACVKLGDVPTDQPAWETKTIAYQADSLGLPAACPAPWTGQLRGWTLSFSYQPACDVAPQIRLAILALTTLGALLMIVTTVRT